MEGYWVVLSAGDPNIFYAGKHIGSKEYLRREMEAGRPIELTEARVVEYRAGVMMGPQGPGISIQNRMWPLPLTQGAGRIHVKAQLLIYPNDIPGLIETLDELCQACTQLEVEMRAKSAGLVAATTLPQGPRRQ